MKIRKVRLANAEKLSALIQKIDHSSKFILWNSGKKCQ